MVPGGRFCLYRSRHGKSRSTPTISPSTTPGVPGVSAGASALLTFHTDAVQRCADAFDIQDVFQRANFTHVDV